MYLLQRPIGCFRQYVPMLRDAAKIWELQLLVFPVLVVVLATASFFFSGHCSPWQWWISVATILAFPWVRQCRRTALLSNGLFLGTLLFLWCLTPFMLDQAGTPDCVMYHLPTIRLLAAGWNPVSDPQATAILEELQLESVGQGWASVSFLPKTAGVFNAVASFFFRDPFALTFPIVGFLSLACLFSIVRASKGHPLLGLSAFLILMHLATETPYVIYVDQSIAFASGGLLFSMFSSQSRGRLYLLHLGVFTFWMANCKLPGCVAAVAFWIVFAAAFLMKHGKTRAIPATRQTVLVAVVVLVVSCMVSFNPYGTSLRDFGHPLYPMRTIDAERFPLMNIPADCKLGNEDWHHMGYFGNWFNSYASPGLVRAWYNRKLGRADFAPHQYIWDYSWEDTEKRSPVPCKARFWIWLAILALLAVPQWRPFALMLVLGISIFPKQYMGYLRYYAWIPAFKTCAFLAVSQWVVERIGWKNTVSICVFLATAIFVLKSIAQTGFSAFRGKERELSIERTRVAALYFHKKWSVPESVPIEGKPLYPEGKAYMNNSILLLRELGKTNTEVVFRPWGETNGFVKTRFGYWIDEADVKTLESDAPFAQLSAARKTLLVLKSIFVDYPRILGRRMSGAFCTTVFRQPRSEADSGY